MRLEARSTKRATFDSGSAETQKLLNDAAAHATIAHRLPAAPGRRHPRFYEGRCYQELGDTKQALVAYDQLIADLPDGDPAFRQLKTQTMRYALECWLQDKNYVAAVDKSLAWSKSARAANCKIPIGWP